MICRVQFCRHVAPLVWLGGSSDAQHPVADIDIKAPGLIANIAQDYITV